MKKLPIYLFISFHLVACGAETNNSSKTRPSESSLATDSLPEGVGRGTYIGGMGNEKDNISMDTTEEMEIEETPVTTEITKPEASEEIKPKTPVVIEEKTPEKPVIEGATAKETVEDAPVEKPKVQAEIHKTWDDLVRKHISSSGKVNYSAFVKDKAKVEKYIKELQSYYPQLKSWGKNKRLAYWINIYNAVTVKLIIDNYPVSTIKTLKGGKPWDTKLITLGEKNYTLNDIENKVIRPKFKEPRIHFAVNCAAKSCPKIMNKAWTEGNIQRYLTKQTKAFLANTTQNQIAADKASISKIFEWYKADFGGSDEKLIVFINKYSTTKINTGATITFNDYNWKLNN